ncbi:hypothetical protein SynWH8101_0053 [Synechococcus sp. WH 8101]|nr:hypothetical protein SynWH8101_0053 [Synechococcus sp. WH 8101]QNI43865.1 hypothetical protein SynRCC2555_00055 [Synechococcus sp. WH 8101]
MHFPPLIHFLYDLKFQYLNFVFLCKRYTMLLWLQKKWFDFR